ncbi:MAG: bifunctional phosphoribosylaminoimidazolecarboxamide formyltransferase/IMP cyclohydrolase [Elusimicrobia bacterium]|nr:bifunctional phosphoribosylaminoimidazolecarboxamide formyltransferase/IMP cyclohydrolase [Elusimicrobiota bacterium]
MTHKGERWALLHVTDKTGIVELAWPLKELGFKFIADKGTAAILRQAELEVSDVASYPGLLRSLAASGETGIKEEAGPRAPSVELAAINLYPLAELAASELSQAETLSYVDAEASALLRAAARQFRQVVCLCDPEDYGPILEALRQHGDVSPERRQALAAKAFHYTAYYDSTVAQYLGSRWEKLPQELVMGLRKSADLGYGENPHQQGALYALSGARPWGVNQASLVYGRPLSFNHYFDLDTAWELAGEFPEPACAIVKHGVPAGAAVSKSLAEAAKLAYRGDPRGCLHGTAAVNREVDEEAAAFFAEEAVNCIAAPGFSAKALLALKAKKDIRLVTLPSTLISAHELDFRSVAGGVLVQGRDHQPLPEPLQVPSKRQPSELERNSLRLAWQAAKHSRTHAAVLAHGGQTVGIGSGQTTRLDTVRLALQKSRERHPILADDFPVVLASDGALSADHILEAAAAGVKAVIQPGFSSEDEGAVEACDEKGLAMAFTGVRHFRH